MYGNAIRQFVVQPGDLWRVGAHRFLCADVEAVDVWQALGRPVVQMIYTDPPWDIGHARMFRRLAGRASDVSLEHLHGRLASLVHACGCPAYVQVSQRAKGQLSDVLQQAGLSCYGEWTLSYRQPGDMCLLLWSAVPIEGQGEDAPEDGASIRWAIGRSSAPGGLVFDPFMGAGATARVAHRLGRIAIGSEIIPAKMALCLRRMRTTTGCIPERATL